MNLKKFIFAGALAFASIIAAQTVSYAQCDPLNPPPGQPYACVIVNGVKVIVDAFGNPVPGASEGDAQFITRQSENVPCQTAQAPQNFNVRVDLGGFGVVQTSLDPSRPSPNSTIVANQAATALPATGTINVYLQATLSTKPGALYRSEGLVTLVNPNVTSFPFVNESFLLRERVVFRNVKDRRDFFTLSETRVVLSSRPQ